MRESKNQQIPATMLAATLACAVALAVASPTMAGPSPEQKCQAGKNDAAGKYAACIDKALKAFVGSADMIKYDAAVAECADKLASSWDKLETGAVSKGASCPSMGDGDAVQEYVDACVASVADAVEGTALPSDVLTCNDALDSCDGDLAACEGELADVQAVLPGCQGDLATCRGLLVNPLSRTGQTICYNDAGTTISCAGTGQDGEIKAGATVSFTDNGNGTITDNVTGLMWEKLSDDGSIHDKDTVYNGLAGAVTKIASLNGAAFASHTDWRVPNRREMFSLSDLGRSNPAINPVFHTGCVGGCTVLTCSCTKNTVYWTSSTYLGYTPATWKVNAPDGDIYAGDRAGDNHAVRAVRNAD
jgi:hypothetical protein